MPDFVVPGLRIAVDKAERYFNLDQKDSIDHVDLPNAFAGKQLKWQFVFASGNTSADPRTGEIGRHHMHTKSVSRAISNAVKKARIMKHVTAHVFRHSLA